LKSTRQDSGGVRVRAVGVVLALCAFAGCGGFQTEEISPLPIAFMRLDAGRGLSSVKDFAASIRMRDESDPSTQRPRLESNIHLLVVPTGELTRVPDAGSGSLPLDWSSDGFRLLVGRPGATSRVQLVTWNRLTGAYDSVPGAHSAGPASIADGPIRVALLEFLDRRDARRLGVLLHLDRGRREQISGGGGDNQPDVSPDGQKVVFVRAGRRSGDPMLMLKTVGEAEPRPIGRGRRPRFSRDGRFIAFLRTRSGNTDVWVMRSDGGAKRRITSSSYDEEFPAMSPDGKHVVYGSVRGDEEDRQLFIARLSDLREIQITQAGQSSRPVW